MAQIFHTTHDIKGWFQPRSQFYNKHLFKLHYDNKLFLSKLKNLNFPLNKQKKYFRWRYLADTKSTHKLSSLEATFQASLANKLEFMSSKLQNSRLPSDFGWQRLCHDFKAKQLELEEFMPHQNFLTSQSTTSDTFNGTLKVDIVQEGVALTIDLIRVAFPAFDRNLFC